MSNQFEHSHAIWDGKLRLNSALTVSTVAIFKGGEKIPDFKWSACIRVKGNVELYDFEEYIRDLHRAPNRGLMVVSLDWKEGSSRVLLEETKKAEETYVENKRVGLANIIDGVKLYVCPRSDTIITMLANHDFLKGRMSNLSEGNKNSFIGCVVWRRYKIPTLPVWSPIHRPSEKIPSHPVWSPIRGPSEKIPTHPVWSPIRGPSEKIPTRPVWSPIRGPLEKVPFFPWSVLLKPNDTSNMLPNLSTEVGTSYSNKNLKPLVEEDNEKPIFAGAPLKCPTCFADITLKSPYNGCYCPPAPNSLTPQCKPPNEPYQG